MNSGVRKLASDAKFEEWYNDTLNKVRHSVDLSKRLRDNKEFMRDAYCSGFWACVDWMVRPHEKPEANNQQP